MCDQVLVALVHKHKNWDPDCRIYMTDDGYVILDPHPDFPKPSEDDFIGTLDDCFGMLADMEMERLVSLGLPAKHKREEAL